MSQDRGKGNGYRVWELFMTTLHWVVNMPIYKIYGVDAFFRSVSLFHWYEKSNPLIVGFGFFAAKVELIYT